MPSIMRVSAVTVTFPPRPAPWVALKKNEPSRIVTVCDAFDAMTNPRAYRGRANHNTALEELRRGCGTQFDPGVIETFLSVFDESVDRAAYGG